MKWIVAYSFIAAALTAAPAQAEDIAVSGSVTYKVTATEGKAVSRQHMSGTIAASDESSVINESEQECYGSFKRVDDKVIGHGFCDTTDADKDVWWLTFEAATDRSEWTVVGGTGKYEGMTGSGETLLTPGDPMAVSAAAPTPWTQRYEGTLKLPSR
jgi:hypothetical protein